MMVKPPAHLLRRRRRVLRLPVRRDSLRTPPTRHHHHPAPSRLRRRRREDLLIAANAGVVASDTKMFPIDDDDTDVQRRGYNQWGTLLPKSIRARHTLSVPAPHHSSSSRIGLALRGRETAYSRRLFVWLFRRNGGRRLERRTKITTSGGGAAGDTILSPQRCLLG
mmetsp:Transcript_25834/g.103208  ORF Transcript_25834/g.103208 Transcript_25834/m.103208 type:complete len:166 (-) Transcript_25834:984-1481(-)